MLRLSSRLARPSVPGKKVSNATLGLFCVCDPAIPALAEYTVLDLAAGQN